MSFTGSFKFSHVQMQQANAKTKQVKCLLIYLLINLFYQVDSQQVMDTVFVQPNHTSTGCVRIPVIATDRKHYVHELTIKMNNIACKDNGLGVYQLDTYRYEENVYEFISSRQLPDGSDYSPRSCSLSANSTHVFIICFHQLKAGKNLADFNDGKLLKCNATIFVYDVDNWQLRQFKFQLQEGYCATSASQDAWVECRYGRFLATSSYSSNRQKGQKGNYVYIFDEYLVMLSKFNVSVNYGEANIRATGNCEFILAIRSSGDNKTPYLREVKLYYNGSHLVNRSMGLSDWHTPFNWYKWVYQHPYTVTSKPTSFGTANFPAYSPFDYGRCVGESSIFNNSYYGITTNATNTNGRFVPLFVYKINNTIKSERIFGLSHIAYACGVYIKDTVILLIETDSCQDAGIFPCVKRIVIDLLHRPINRVGKVLTTTLDSTHGTTTISTQRVAHEPKLDTLAVIIVNLLLIILGLCVWVITKLFLRFKLRPHRWLNRVKILVKRSTKS
ncbi:TM-glycoprotein [Morelia viridis nidovirus]|uniref:Putative HN protein n=1 Tax=Morelia viridis nidovirus TaxID=2016400 RepID=A0A6B9D0B9_9NIDO|nr:TM-glycoprotein [Morelia viridis nidovirus]QGW58073.1 putative HN protein [Morelia viridis nidovirus]QGW58080.1 TM-glycoprotein [Morelia viridis nidovirus]